MHALLLPIILLFAGAVQAEWNHTVIMNPYEGSTYNVPLPAGRACVYVTDCTENILNPTPAPPAAPEPTPPEPEPTTSKFNIIDRAGWTVEVDDEEPQGGASFKSVNVLDGDPTSMWHTTWSADDPDPPHPHQIVVDMKTEHYVDSVIYTPRAYDDTKDWSENGNVTDYEVWVSKDNQIWARVASGTLEYASPGEEQTIELMTPNLVRYVKLIGLADINNTNYMNVGEINITETLEDIVITGGGVS